jgi:hypothetical protein
MIQKFLANKLPLLGGNKNFCPKKSRNKSKDFLIKRGLFVSLIFLFLLSFVTSSINITSSDVKNNYSLNEQISGSFNISINEEDIDSILSLRIKNGTEEILLKDISLREFLSKNSISSLNCIPSDCNEFYSLASSGEQDITLELSNGEERVVGFLLKTDNDNSIFEYIDYFNLHLISTFEQTNLMPIVLDFFGKQKYRYGKITEDFSQRQDFGCYNPSLPSGSIHNVILKNACERVLIPESSALRVGAFLTPSGSPDGEVYMSLYDSKGKQIIDAGCSYKPSEEGSCDMGIDVPLSLDEGYYFVCAHYQPAGPRDPKYYISRESSGAKCGLNPSSLNPSISVTNLSYDYSIWASLPEYQGNPDVSLCSSAFSYSGDCEEIPSSSDDFSLVENMENYIKQKYKGKCKDGCIIPIRIRGVDQDVTLNLGDEGYFISSYFLTDGDQSDPLLVDKIYELSVDPALVSFNGSLDLSKTEAVFDNAGRTELRIYLGDNLILNKSINVLQTSLIKSIYPLNVPAGVPARLFVDVDSGARTIKSYTWEFEDGEIKTTSINYIDKVFNEMKVYKVKVSVLDSSNFTSSKEFSVVAGSPREVLDVTIKREKENLKRIYSKISAFDEPYKTTLLNVVQYDAFVEELANNEKLFNESTTEEEALLAAIQIDALNIPYSIMADVSTTPLIPESESIDPSIISQIGSGEFEETELTAYQEAIANWQLENIQGIASIKKVYVVDEKGNKGFLLIIENVDLTSNSDEDSYLVISPSEGLNLTGIEYREAMGVVYATVPSESQTSFEFSLSSGSTSLEDPVIFISPDLADLEIVASALGECNYNKKCEEGENSQNCMNDCKPIGKILLYILFILIFGIILYSVIAVWYKLKYEEHLFKDRRNLFNLLSFVKNARERGISEESIKEGLKKKGWTNEQIIYVIKKYKGKRTGMFEIIPLSKLFDLKPAKGK